MRSAALETGCLDGGCNNAEKVVLQKLSAANNNRPLTTSARLGRKCPCAAHGGFALRGLFRREGNRRQNRLLCWRGFCDTAAPTKAASAEVDAVLSGCCLAAGHAKNDIAEVAARQRSCKHGGMTMRYPCPLGSHEQHALELRRGVCSTRFGAGGCGHSVSLAAWTAVPPPLYKKTFPRTPPMRLRRARSIVC